MSDTGSGRTDSRRQAADEMVQTSARKRKREDAVEPGPPVPRLFSVDEYYAMAQAGILQPDERTELLEGVIFCMAAMGSRHAARVTRFGYRLIAAFMGRALVRIQAPIHMGERSEPEPDIAVVRLRADDYEDAHPVPQDVYLLVEVSDSSLVFDRRRKLPLYAAAGIPELWIVDIQHQRVLVYRSPRGNRYEQETIVGRGGSLAPQAFSDVSLAVDDLLGPAASTATA
jgi:Uma2 family endonuclease